MKNWESLLITPKKSIREALLVIDTGGVQMAVVADENHKLIGTISDGDIRRALLKGLTLSDIVEACMCKTPHAARESDDADSILSQMRRNKLRLLPIVDDRDVIVGMEVLDDYLMPEARANWVVLMAGGLGTRLGDLTKDIPKPMLNVGDKPLLEIILRRFVELGFRNFYIAVNHMADVIETHFGNGESYGAQIRYLKESKRLGTAGALSLIPEMPLEPVLVANGDLLANIDYGAMLDSHVDSGAAATMGVSEYQIEIPYGVIQEKQGVIQKIEEKPIQKSLISAGVYVLSPSVIRLVPKDVFFDMPTLFKTVLEKHMKASVYRMQGYWLDIGRASDYQKANTDIESIFNRE